MNDIFNFAGSMVNFLHFSAHQASSLVGLNEISQGCHAYFNKEYKIAANIATKGLLKLTFASTILAGACFAIMKSKGGIVNLADSKTSETLDATKIGGGTLSADGSDSSSKVYTVARLISSLALIFGVNRFTYFSVRQLRRHYRIVLPLRKDGLPQQQNQIDSNTTQSESLFSSLPEELIQLIISFLPYSELKNFGLVSQRFRDSAKYCLRTQGESILKTINECKQKSKEENRKFIQEVVQELGLFTAIDSSPISVRIPSGYQHGSQTDQDVKGNFRERCSTFSAKKILKLLTYEAVCCNQFLNEILLRFLSQRIIDKNEKVFKSQFVQPLMNAIKFNNQKMVKVLLKCGADADPDWVSTTRRRTHGDKYEVILPLRLAIKNNNVPLVELLIPYVKEINRHDKWGETALLFACNQEGINCKILKLLLQRSADPNIESAGLMGRHKYPLQCAVEQKNYKAVKTLLKFKADPKLPSAPSLQEIAVKNNWKHQFDELVRTYGVANMKI